MIVEMYTRSGLYKRQVCPDNLDHGEVIRHFGINERWSVAVWPEGRPDQREVIQHERNP